MASGAQVQPAPMLALTVTMRMSDQFTRSVDSHTIRAWLPAVWARFQSPLP